MENKRKSNLFFSLYDSVHLRLYSFLLLLVHNQSDAEDILQETASTMWEKFEEFEEGTNFGAWAVSIAHYKALEFMKKNKRSRMVFKEEYYEQIALQAQETPDDMTDRIQVMKQCLEKLSDKDKKLLAMRYKKNIPLKRISKMTGRSSSGICQSFSRIITLLRTCVSRRLTMREA